MGLSIALAQLNPTVGDVAGNRRVRGARDRAAALGADLVVFSELVLVGYPPEDLVLRPALVRGGRCGAARARAETAPRGSPAWSSRCPGAPTDVCTMPWRWSPTARPSSVSSTSCPTTASSTRSASSRRARCRSRSSFRGVRIGMPICEDIWFPAVTAHLARAGRRAAARAERIAVRGREVPSATRPRAAA